MLDAVFLTSNPRCLLVLFWFVLPAYFLFFVFTSRFCNLTYSKDAALMYDACVFPVHASHPFSFSWSCRVNLRT